GDITLRQPRAHGLEVVPAQHLDRLAGPRVLAGGADHLARPPGWAGAVERRRGAPQDVVEPAVIVTLELEDDRAAGGGAGQPDRCLHRLRAGAGEADAFGARHDRAEQLGRLELDLGL